MLARAALINAWPEFEDWGHDSQDDYSQSEIWRQLWRTPGDLVCVEQDVVVPPGLIEELLACPHDWCTPPAWNGFGYLPETCNVVKFSASLREREPYLCDYALADRWRTPRQDPRTPLARLPRPDDRPDLWPSDRAFGAVDYHFARLLVPKIGHAHADHPPAVHLHDYRPIGGRPDPGWEALGYDPEADPLSWVTLRG